MDEQGRARLKNYGLNPMYPGTSVSLVAMWLAPEIKNPAYSTKVIPTVESKEGDVFAFGMVALEAFTGSFPFCEDSWKGARRHILGGGRPSVPENTERLGLSSEVWDLINRCWEEDPLKRPTMEDVVRELQEATGGDGGPSGAPDQGT